MVENDSHHTLTPFDFELRSPRLLSATAFGSYSTKRVERERGVLNSEGSILPSVVVIRAVKGCLLLGRGSSARRRTLGGVFGIVNESNETRPERTAKHLIASFEALCIPGPFEPI
jgi:hypothetical protein